ncbi:hypothetical protein PC129_g11189 [Phytophthora cactorum]|uniref:Uncharacterized protein n=1 Tax=Phytophthora cactorum TaxID=29920 RepID=A0A8T1KIC6_9STRA|nr:hypothetical protein Pcac1_g17311 [Phytophthora cactorum]KAG2818100.1 hypothetical protein PC112_g12769 [Phytophthora cactorum]KAG2820261.1 hypothetical protein PC111_g11548 [Phytophthora cactorum]KAG2899885.1 hypothetical protein PC114_g13751 [Phytophthora cactorum]KAG2913306.1 hypothetical protein PC115_g12123 [Phytophthora cactorum]
MDVLLVSAWASGELWNVSLLSRTRVRGHLQETAQRPDVWETFWRATGDEGWTPRGAEAGDEVSGRQAL